MGCVPWPQSLTMGSCGVKNKCQLRVSADTAASQAISQGERYCADHLQGHHAPDKRQLSSTARVVDHPFDEDLLGAWIREPGSLDFSRELTIN